MSKASQNKNVMLISGTSRGIGRFLAEHYIKQGFYVIGCSRSGGNIESESYKHFEIDISDEKNIQHIFSYIRKEHKKLDVLINNAAINPMIVPASFLPSDVIEKTYKVNVFATMIFCREAVKIMSRNKFGRIINIGSIATKHNVKGESLYTSSKAAVETFTKVLAKEVYSYGITANVLAPSLVKTDMAEKINEKSIQQILSRNAIDQFGEMGDISNMIDFLIKDESSAFTGQIFYLGGA